MLPDFIGLGASRSGSTWLAQNLMQHPELCMPRKEMHFFDRYYDQGITYYEAQFESCPQNKLRGEVTPAYFHTEVVASRISEHVPDAKLFVSLRDPIDRAYSHYWRMVATEQVAETDSFEEVLQQHEFVLWTGMSSQHLARYYRYFDQELVYVTLFDDIKKRPAQLLRGLYSFLGIDPDFDSPLVEQRVNAAASLQNLARSRLSWYANRVLARVGIHSLSGKVEQLNRTVLPPMKPETRQYLIDYYREDVLALESLLGRDLQSWLVAESPETA